MSGLKELKYKLDEFLTSCPRWVTWPIMLLILVSIVRRLWPGILEVIQWVFNINPVWFLHHKLIGPIMLWTIVMVLFAPAAKISLNKIETRLPKFYQKLNIPRSN